MNYNLNSGYGSLLASQIASAVGPNFGQVLIVSEDSDNQRIKDMLKEAFVPDPDGRVRFFTTLNAAYTAAESNSNDVILLSGHSSHTITPITWSKNRVNVIGMDGGGRLVQQGTKVQNSATDTEAFVLKVTGTRNSFRNIKFIQSSTNAAALNVVQFAGEGNLWEDCSFVFGVADNLDLTTSSEALIGEDAGTFRRCSFGTDVLLTSAARSVATLDAITGGNADGAKSNRFIECEFFVMSSSATATLVKLADTSGAKFLNKFIDCTFDAVKNNTNSAAAITNAVASASGFVEGSIVFYNPAGANLTNFCAGTTDNVVTYGPATAATAGEGGTPS